MPIIFITGYGGSAGLGAGD